MTPTVEAPSPSTSPTGYSHVTPTVEAPSPSTSPTGYSHVIPLNTTISPMSLGSTPHSCLTQSTPPVLTAQPSPMDPRKASIITPVSKFNQRIFTKFNQRIEQTDICPNHKKVINTRTIKHIQLQTKVCSSHTTLLIIESVDSISTSRGGGAYTAGPALAVPTKMSSYITTSFNSCYLQSQMCSRSRSYRVGSPGI